ncbi:MAG: hypothetical protein JF616_22590 [Fibrobacteres bacterium]|jgi:hypothetical protein|nr:hypothetical protein [Fibrobacterota bacterium]
MDLELMDFNWRVEEYRALRAEILANEDYQKNLVIWGTTILAGALGVMFKSECKDFRFILVFLTNLLACSFWLTWAKLTSITESIGTYIWLYHEKVSPMNWELFQRIGTFQTGKENVIDEGLGSGNPAIKGFLGIFSIGATSVPFMVVAFLTLCLLYMSPPDILIWPVKMTSHHLGLVILFRIFSLFLFILTTAFVVLMFAEIRPDKKKDKTGSQLLRCERFRFRDAWYLLKKRWPLFQIYRNEVPNNL